MSLRSFSTEPVPNVDRMRSRRRITTNMVSQMKTHEKEGKTIREIAELVGCSHSAVQRHIGKKERPKTLRERDPLLTEVLLKYVS